MPDYSTNRHFESAKTLEAYNLHKKNNDQYSPDSNSEVLYYLDMGMLNHYIGNYELSNEMLSNAENAIEKNFTKSLSTLAISLLIDDRSLDYSGEDYEDVYLNVFKALNYYKLDKFDEALVEIRRVNEKLKNLNDKYNRLAYSLNQTRERKKRFTWSKVKFYASPLASYLSFLFYCAKGQYDDARIDIENTVKAYKNQNQIYDFQVPQHILQKFQCIRKENPEECLFQKNLAKLNVITFIGRTPEKKEKTYWAISQKNKVIISKRKDKKHSIDVIPWPEMPAGYYIKFSVPYMEAKKTNINKIKLFVDDNYIEMVKLDDLSSVATYTFDTKKNLIYLKTFIRSVLKGIAAKKLRDKINNLGRKELPKLDFLFNTGKDILIGLTLGSIEHADTRISSFFPGCAYVSEVNIKPGIYNIALKYYGHNNQIIKTTNFGKQKITEKGINLFTSSFFSNK